MRGMQRWIHSLPSGAARSLPAPAVGCSGRRPRSSPARFDRVSLAAAGPAAGGVGAAGRGADARLSVGSWGPQKQMSLKRDGGTGGLGCVDEEETIHAGG